MYRLTALVGAVFLAFSPGLAQAQQPVPAAPAPSYEYVQQASSLQFDGTTLTLQGVSPSTVFFTDRPYRLTGLVSTGQFAELWNAPDGPFASNPPNAAVSVLGNIKDAPAIVELTSAEMDGVQVKYGVKVLSGELPESADNVALFVDHGPNPHRQPVSGRHVGYYPYHPIPGPYCYHAPQDPECHYHPYHPYPPYPPYPYHPYYYPGAAFAAGAAVGAAAASQPQATYIYPIPAGPIPAHCYINSAHTRMICSVPIN
ncbi:hypothetical protein [Nitratireductor sp. XY-223]|uniref:hypothetical protein n=1 Tax=Nitratireductor sp. XY-223 TaxID=2561926 RepID=UPI0010A9E82E|nr:hypothetical protein [Nitratireductor sp. XY-223]